MAFGQSQPPNGLAAASAAKQIRVAYVEKPGLLGLAFKNFLLNLVTLTFYRFWAKTNVRKHVWSSIQINDEPLEYTGTGKELFIGALVIFCVLIAPVIAVYLSLQLIYGPQHVFTYTAQGAFVFVGFLLWGMAIYRAKRYRLSRTLWRGIRGTMGGSSVSFSLIYFASMFLRGITLGWSSPAMNLALQNRLTGEMKFGETSFGFSGSAGPLYSRYAFCWFATPFVLILFGAAGYLMTGIDVGELREIFSTENPDVPDGFGGLAVVGVLLILAVVAGYGILWTFYTAREMALFAQYTRFDSATFTLDVTVSSLVMLWLGNMLILLLTIGIGQPFIVQRIARYMVNRLSIDGAVDVTRIQQSTARVDKHGEGLLDAFDVDGF